MGMGARSAGGYGGQQFAPAGPGKGGRRPSPQRFPGGPGKGGGGQPQTNQWSPGPMPGSSYNQPQLPGGYGQMRYEPQQFSSYGVPTSIAQPDVFGWGRTPSGLETPGSQRGWGDQQYTLGAGGNQWSDRFGRGWGTGSMPPQQQQQQFGGGPGKGGRGQPSPQQFPGGPGKGGGGYGQPAPPRGFPGGPGKGGGGYGQAQQLGQLQQAQQTQQLQRQLQQQLQPAGQAQQLEQQVPFDPDGIIYDGGPGSWGGGTIYNPVPAEVPPPPGDVGIGDFEQKQIADQPSVTPQRWTPQQKAAWGQQQQAQAPITPQRWTPQQKAAWGQQQRMQTQQVSPRWTPAQQRAWRAGRRANGGIVGLYWPGGRVY